MGPFASVILQWALLPGAAIRDSLKPESLVLDAGRDGCLEEAKRIEQLMRDLAYPGPLEGNHCDWPGITCWQNCRVEKIECENCSGHLPEKIELRHLWEVSLTSPTLTGNIKAFSGIQLLNSLELKGTEITGELEVFREDNFVRLLLADTKISGNLQSLARMELRELDLSGTAISGDLQSLVGDVDWYSSESISKRRLRHLKLGRTNITGRLSSLTRFPILKEVDLSYTSVSGWVDSSWRNKCKDLLILQLRKTSVQFVPVGEELERLKDHWTGGRLRLFPKLKELDVTHCPVNNTVENLLLPLAMSQLSTIKAAAAGISGVVPQLAKELTNLNAAKKLEDVHFILPDNLVILDLSFNNITGVNGLPVLPHSGRVLLRENSQLVVPSKVLTEALKHQIILDLSGTNLSNKEEIAQLLAKGEVKTTDMYAHRNDLAGYACKDLVGTVKVAPETFVPDEMCKCLAGWHGHGATCQICPADQFSDEMGLDICKMCPPNSTAPEGSTKLAHCKCDFGNLHNGTCSCDKHHALIKGDCVLCSKLHLQCNTSGVSASSALPEISFTRLQRSAEEAHRCLPPGELERCPGNHQCGLGYDGTLCATCAAGFWAKAGRCRPCAEMNSTSIWYAVFLGVAALVVAAFLAYRHVFLPRQVAPPVSVKSLLQKLITLQAPVLLQMVQLWSVLSRLGRSSSSPSGESSQSLPEVPYLEALQLTTTELQNSLNLQCAFNAETVRMLAALSSPVAPLLLLACCAALELYRAGFGVSMALKTLTLLFIGGASSASELLSCQSVDGDGESLGDFAFRKAIRHLRCSETDGVAFWVDMVGYSSALAYGVLIPLFLVGLMVRQYFALQEARLFYASAEGGTPQHVTLRLQTLHGQLPEEALPKRLLAAVAAHMAVHCRGKWLVQLQDGYISATSSGGEEIPADHLDLMKVVADAKTSRNIDVLRSRRVAEMLTERIMLEEAKDRWLIGSQALLCKYMLCQDVWMHLVMKLFAVALVSRVSMSDAWKWAIAFSLGMAVLVGACQPYMWPQVSQLQSLSCFCLALASLAFVYDCAWLARIALLAPVLLLLWQVLSPDCTEALAERLYQELQLELPKFQRGEGHEVIVQQLRFGRGRGRDDLRGRGRLE